MTLIGGIGVGFAVASCLFFFVIAAAARGSKEQQKETREVNRKTVYLLEQRNQIDSKIAGHLHTLAQCALEAVPNVKPSRPGAHTDGTGGTEVANRAGQSSPS